MKNKIIIKKKGHEEAYDNRKVYVSVFASVLNAEYGEKKAKLIAKKVADGVNLWVKKQSRKNKKISSNNIRSQVLKNIKDRDVALLYKHHLDFS